MTRITKPVVRETLCTDRNVPIIATMYGTYLELRPKGTRRRYTISYDACLWLAVKRELEDKRREKLAAKKGKARR